MLTTQPRTLCKYAISVVLLACTFRTSALNSTEQRWVDAVNTTYGERAAQRVRTWRDRMSESHNLAERDKLETINRFFNQLQFVSDLSLWGKQDYWATPLEFLGSNGGDCEDFTIAKYFSLIELGISDKKLRLVYVKALELNQFHMVLAYYESEASEPLILDNLKAEIVPASKRPDLKPIYSFNGQHLWLMKTNPKLAGKSSRLSLWNELRNRQSSMKLNRPIQKLQ